MAFGDSCFLFCLYQVNRINVIKRMFRIICLVLSLSLLSNADECKSTITTASGPNAPHTICSGQLIFEENFDHLDKQKWGPMETFWDGGVS